MPLVERLIEQRFAYLDGKFVIDAADSRAEVLRNVQMGGCVLLIACEACPRAQSNKHPGVICCLCRLYGAVVQLGKDR
jgi:hypothetical protein